MMSIGDRLGSGSFQASPVAGHSPRKGVTSFKRGRVRAASAWEAP